ncbi:hypothetical protein Hamer_G022960 [Homarus americanus]|uniref:Uncharacterized protein n=1 Tax=Homarus americanus TaxID=6706 RepID=A0A8J5K643_HOMAM|nr:hypothetical protein Hamer_G022960 [Homarus americanus]
MEWRVLIVLVVMALMAAYVGAEAIRPGQNGHGIRQFGPGGGFNGGGIRHFGKEVITGVMASSGGRPAGDDVKPLVNSDTLDHAKTFPQLNLVILYDSHFT